MARQRVAHPYRATRALGRRMRSGARSWLTDRLKRQGLCRKVCEWRRNLRGAQPVLQSECEALVEVADELERMMAGDEG